MSSATGAGMCPFPTEKQISGSRGPGFELSPEGMTYKK